VKRQAQCALLVVCHAHPSQPAPRIACRRDGAQFFRSLTAVGISITVFVMSKTAAVIPKRVVAKHRKAGTKHAFRRRVLPAPEPLRYEAEDIDEANRIGAAICRQHAR
jgi:hypothetical protein